MQSEHSSEPDLPSAPPSSGRHQFSVIIGKHDPDPRITLREWVAEVWADTKSALILLAVGGVTGIGVGAIIGWMVWS